MNAHASAARSLREVPGLQGNYDRTAQNFRVLKQLYAAEQEKLAVEKEMVRKLENDLEELRSEKASLLSRLDKAETSRQGAKRSLKDTEKSLKRRKRVVRAFGRQFKRTLREVKDKLCGTRAQTVRDFLNSESYR